MKMLIGWVVIAFELFIALEILQLFGAIKINMW